VATGRQALVSSLAATLDWMQAEIANEQAASRSPPSGDRTDQGALSRCFDAR
jgi:hypothetical protein